MEIKIEKALPTDAEKLLEYLKIVGGETDNLSFGGEGVPFSVEAERDYLTSLQGSTTAGMFVAKRGEEIVGIGSYSGMTGQRMGHRGELAVSVKRSAWGMGIGGKLVERVIDFAKNTAQADILSLEVRSDNARAIHLYQKFGFEKIGTFPGFFKIDGAYVDFDLMNLYLNR